jgi:hypothetical protein
VITFIVPFFSPTGPFKAFQGLELIRSRQVEALREFRASIKKISESEIRHDALVSDRNALQQVGRDDVREQTEEATQQIGSEIAQVFQLQNPDDVALQQAQDQALQSLKDVFEKQASENMRRNRLRENADALVDSEQQLSKMKSERDYWQGEHVALQQELLNALQQGLLDAKEWHRQESEQLDGLIVECSETRARTKREAETTNAAAAVAALPLATSKETAAAAAAAEGSARGQGGRPHVGFCPAPP